MSNSHRSTARARWPATRGRALFSGEQWDSIAGSLKLSAREFQIVQAIFDNEIEAAIGAQLGISSHTVHTYLERLYRKLGVGSRCGLLVRVFAEYLVLQ